MWSVATGHPPRGGLLGWKPELTLDKILSRMIPYGREHSGPSLEPVRKRVIRPASGAGLGVPATSAPSYLERFSRSCARWRSTRRGGRLSSLYYSSADSKVSS